MDLPVTFEVIVNNDSNDIQEVNNPLCSYYYEQFDDLSKMYEFLYNKSVGEYVYYLEDDDILMNGICCALELLDNDVHIGLYKTESKVMFKQSIADMIDGDYQFEYFQLGQMIFKRKEINFPSGNDVMNDEVLLKTLLSGTNNVKQHKSFFFEQGLGDNMSKDTLTW